MKRPIATTLIGLVLLVGFNAEAQQTPEAESITTLLRKGFQIVAGTALSEEQTSKEALNTSPPISYGEAKYRSGVVYLSKGAQAAVCEYRIVTSPSGGVRPMRNGSLCHWLR